jgi:hypothetical protein
VRRLFLGAGALVGILLTCWIVGTLWISAREPAVTAVLPAAFPGHVIEVGACRRHAPGAHRGRRALLMVDGPERFVTEVEGFL